LENTELSLYESGGVDTSKLVRKYTTIEMDGKPFLVRTAIYDKGGEDRKTLVMTHGYIFSSVLAFFKILEPLSEHYRIVMFDHISYGLNSRVQDVGDALESWEKSDEWMNTWWDKLIAKLTEQGDIP
jgi:pimeloyl-ACP methyl ester carboxylesterase